MNKSIKQKWLHWGSFAVYFALMGLLVFSGCGKDKNQETGQARETGRIFLSIGTAPPGGAFFVVGGAIAQVVSDHTSAMNWEVTAEATKGSQENIRRLSKGELDFALANAAISYFALRGEGAWEQKHDIRAVMTLAPNVALFLAKRSSDIRTIHDLKGKRVVVGPAGAGFEYFLQPILKAHGVEYDDFTPLNATQAASVDMLADGSASAAFLGGAIPTASIVQATASQDIHFVLFGENEKQELVRNYPFFEPVTIPSGTYRDQVEDFHGMNVGSMHLITSARVDDETVYQLTKALYEHRAEVVQKHPAGKAINPKNIVRNTGIPFHPGAIRYFREIQIWPEESTE